MTKLHLGCGAKYISGFEHIDSTYFPHLRYCADVSRLKMYNENSVDLIYASHVLEHFGRHEYLAVLEEWFRVLRPGGVLRLAVPDFEAVVKLYPKRGVDSLLGLVCGGQKNETDYHKMIFDEVSLGNALKQIGFTSYRRWDWKETEHAHIDDYSQAYIPHMEKENGQLVSLNIEAFK